ncbi:MAG: hypothetical protein J6Y92_04885 [Lentisphaeria bacterium]|nr:hypothetical protein [Lentisphaeria bacterium]
MLKTLFRGGLALAASFCSVLFTSCGITPLYYPPIDDKSPAEMFDAETCAALLKGGPLQSDDNDVTIAFSECKDDVILTASSTLKDGSEKHAVRGYVTIIDDGDKEKADGKKEEKDETWLPVLIVPFRNAGKLYFYLVVDQMYLVEKYKLNPEYIFMMRPYSYILTAERKDGGWEVGFVQFATTGLEVKKVAEKAQLDKDGTVLNPPAEILEMLKDPKNYEISSKTAFQPVKK